MLVSARFAARLAATAAKSPLPKRLSARAKSSHKSTLMRLQEATQYGNEQRSPCAIPTRELSILSIAA
eukprot:6210551-Pleurochrysis_carterae.AAC.5